MGNEFEKFADTFESPNTVKVINSLQALGEYNYNGISPVDLERIVLDMKPNSPKSITTILYVLSLYAKYLEDDRLYNIVQDIDRKALWIMAKPNASKKFISNSQFKETCKDVELFEEYNSSYISTLFKCIYEGIYSDDMSVIKNLRGSNVNGNIVTITEDNGNTHELSVSDRLAKEIVGLGNVNTWSRNNRFGECKIKTTGLYEDSCFKVETRGGSDEYSYRYTYYRILRKVSKDYLGYNLLPLQLYVSGIMYRIRLNLEEHGVTLDEAFAPNNKNRLVNKIISDELVRCNCDTEVRNFREIVKGHIDVFCK